MLRVRSDVMRGHEPLTRIPQCRKLDFWALRTFLSPGYGICQSIFSLCMGVLKLTTDVELIHVAVYQLARGIAWFILKQVVHRPLVVLNLYTCTQPRRGSIEWKCWSLSFSRVDSIQIHTRPSQLQSGLGLVLFILNLAPWKWAEKWCK